MSAQGSASGLNQPRSPGLRGWADKKKEASLNARPIRQRKGALTQLPPSRSSGCGVGGGAGCPDSKHLLSAFSAALSRCWGITMTRSDRLAQGKVTAQEL